MHSLTLWLAAMLALPALANDTLATLGAGGLIPIKSEQIGMEREELEISPRQISVRYLFRNHGARDIEATVAFPLPVLDGGLVEHEPLKLPRKGRTNFVDFQVFVGGRRIPVKVETRAFHEQDDITSRLLAAPLPVSVIDPAFASAVKKLPVELRKELETAELIVSDEAGEPAYSPQRRYWPNWQTRIQYYWQQRFPAHASVEVRQTYRPVVGGSYITANKDGAETVKRYCGGAEALQRIQEVKARHPGESEDEPVMVERRIQYVLTTANNWNGPIRDFRLSIVADSAEDIVLTCIPGLKQVAPTRYELARQDFNPERELEILILQPGKPSY